MKMEKEKIISHLKQDSKNGSWVIQTNEEHSKGVAEFASEFCQKFGMRNHAYWCGILHDLGKERHTFQGYIRKMSGYDNNSIIDGEHAHAYIGALASIQLLKNNGLLPAMAIAGHHRGLYDWDNLKYILSNNVIPGEIKLPIMQENVSHEIQAEIQTEQPWDIHMITRMLFSALVDADYLDTERFMNPEIYLLRKKGEHVSILLSKLEAYLVKLKKQCDKSSINEIRNIVQNCCRQSGNLKRGIFSLTVPTGGGKTLSSILWALKHCVANGMDGIIIAIPYTSIIEQTTEIFRKIFGSENILEHHSNITDHEDLYNKNDDELGNSNTSFKENRLATENWDCPIVVTTNVQLFESLYHHRPSKCRKLHNIANKVIILDETQSLPPQLLQPLVRALDTLVRRFNCSILTTTASQPILKGTLKGSGGKKFIGFDQITEIIPQDNQLHEDLNRVKIIFDQEKIDCKRLASDLIIQEKVLCIVNTRQIANEVFCELKTAGVKDVIHLSRMMCGNHIKKVLKDIKGMVANPEKQLVVISTQLIEAGVDLDFPVVYRQEAGLDSILQAAGRCNRDGKLRELGLVRVFSLDKIKGVPNGLLTYANDARKNMPYFENISSPQAIERYFMDYYKRCGDFDKHDMEGLLWKNGLNFETASKEFKYINSSLKI